MRKRRARTVRRASERSPAFRTAYAIVEPYMALGMNVVEASRAAIADGRTTRSAWDALEPALLRLVKKLGLQGGLEAEAARLAEKGEPANV